MRRFLLGRCVLALQWMFIITIPAFAQETADSTGTVSLRAGSMTVRVGPRTAFELQAGIEEMTLEERLEVVNRRIARARARGETVLERRVAAPDSSRWEIRLGESLVIIVGPNDAEAAGIPADSLSSIWLAGMRAAVDAEARTQEIRSAAWKVGVGLLFPALLWIAFLLLGRFWLRMERHVEKIRQQGGRGVYIRGFALIQPGTMTTVIPPMVRILKGATYLAVIYAGVVLFFSLFPQTRPLGNQMLEAVLAPVIRFGRSALDFVPLMTAAVVVTLLVRFALRVIDFILDRIDQGFVPRAARAHRLLFSLKHVIRPVIIAVAALFILSYTPGRGATLVEYATIGLLALIIIGFWRPFESVMADIILSYIRPFREGDTLRIEDITGVIVHQSAFFVRLRDDKGRMHVIPKRRLLDADFTNEGRPSDIIPVRVQIQTDLSRPVEAFERLCEEAIKQADGLEEGASVRIREVDLKNDRVMYEISGRVRGPRHAEKAEEEIYRYILGALQTESKASGPTGRDLE